MRHEVGYIDGYPVVELEPDLFFALDGEALDFRGTIPTVRNIKLVKYNGTLHVQIILLGLLSLASSWQLSGALQGLWEALSGTAVGKILKLSFT